MKFNLPDGDGFQEITIREGDNGQVHIDLVSKEDVTEILEANKKAQREGRAYLGKGTQTSAYRLGQVSPLMMLELTKKGIWQDDNALRKWFKDLDNYLWRVDPYRRKNAVQNTQIST